MAASVAVAASSPERFTVASPTNAPPSSASANASIIESSEMSAAPLGGDGLVVLALVVVVEDGEDGRAGEGRGRASSLVRSSSRGASTRSTWTRSHGGRGTRSKKAASPSGSPAGAVAVEAASSTERAAGDSTASSSSEDSPSAHRLVHAHQPSPSVASSGASAGSSARSSGAVVTPPSSRGSARADPRPARRRGATTNPAARLEETVLRERRVAPFSPTWRDFRGPARGTTRASNPARAAERLADAQAPPFISSRACDTRPHRVRVEANARATAADDVPNRGFWNFFGGWVARDVPTAQIPRPRAKRTRNWLRATRDSSANRTRRRRSVESGRLPRVREPSFWDGRADVSAALVCATSIVAYFGDTHVIFRRRPHLRPRVRGGAPRATQDPVSHPDHADGG